MNSYQGPPNISAGIFGRMGPGGGSLGTGVNARPITEPSNVNLKPKNTPYTGRLLPNTVVTPQSFLSRVTRGLKSLGQGTAIQLGLLGLDTTLRATNPNFAAKRNIADAYAAKYGLDYSLTPQEMAAKLAKTGDIDPLTMRQLYGGSGDMDAGMEAYKEATGRGGDNKVRGRSGAKRAQQKAAAEAADPLAMRERYGGSGDMDASDSATYTRQDGYVFDSDVAPPAPNLPPPPPSNDVPASSAEQTMMDPYAYNLAVYGQGRQLATTKDERAAVRDLGLAINRSLYPKLNKTQDINPLLQATFPERTNDTLTGNINSRGTTLPGSMTEADSGSELATAQIQDTPYQATFRLGMMQGQEADQRMNVLNDATTLVEQLMGQAQADEIRRRLQM